MKSTFNFLKIVGQHTVEVANMALGVLTMILFMAIASVVAIIAVSGCYLTFSQGGTYVGTGIVCTLAAILWALARQGCFRRAAVREMVRQY